MHKDISKVVDINKLLMKVFSEKLLERRNEMKLTKAELAKAMREIDAENTITVSTISRWELGDTFPSGKNLIILDKIFGPLDLHSSIPDWKQPEVSKYGFSDQLEHFYRRKYGTQTAFANSIHVAQNTVSDWKNGKSKPDPDMMEMIINLLEVPDDTAEHWRKYYTNTHRK